jgi:filamentous hemagglutinin family protein
MRLNRTPSPLRNRLLAATAASAALMAAGSAWALPAALPGPYQTNTGAQPTITSGNNQVTVDLRAQRTIIDWANFNIASGETVTFAFDFRNWIVLNRVGSGQVSIDGTLRGIQAATPTAGGPPGGNIWIYSPGGVAFGPNARVDLGGLLATSAAVNATEFLTTNNPTFNLTGSGSGGPVTIASGAQISADGNIGFIAPTVTSGAGATVTGRGQRTSVMYAAVDSAQMVLRPIELGDFNLLDFVVPNAAAGTPNANPINLAGTTRTANIFILTTGRQTLGSVLINAPGLLVAQSSVQGNGQVKIATGRQLINNGFAVGTESQQVPGAPRGNIVTGDIIGQGYTTMLTVGDTGIGDITINSLQAGGTAYFVGRNITFGAGGVDVTFRGTTTAGDDDLRFDSSGVVTVPRATVVGDFDVFRGVQQTAARGALGLITGNYGAITAGGFIHHFNGAAITATGPLVSGGETQLFGTQDVRLTNLTTGGYTRVSSSLGIFANNITGVDLDIRSAGGVTANNLVGSTSVSVGTAGVATISSIVGPTLSLNALTARLGTVAITGDATIRTTGMELTTSLTATNLTIEGSGGLFQLGGTTEPGLTNAEFQRIRVTGALNLYAGLQAPNVNVSNPSYGGFTVGDLTVDPTRVPQLNLFARNGQEVLVRGTISVTGPDGAIRIGDPAAGSVWAPERITITGAIGTAQGDPLAGFTDVHAFEHVELYATHDILLGSQRFVDLVLPVSPSDIDIGRGLPLGVAAEGSEIGKLFVVAGNLRLTAGERIVQQNTGSLGREGGLYLTGAGVAPNEPLLVIGGAQVADLFGAFDSGDGVLAIGAAGAFSNRIARPDGDTSQGRIRINGCLLGIGCALSTPASQFRIEQFQPASAGAAIDPPVLTPPRPVDDDEREAEAVITGTGNEEIWRKEPK